LEKERLAASLHAAEVGYRLSCWLVPIIGSSEEGGGADG